MMPPSQDDTLRSLLFEKVERARAGESEAFTQLFEHYHTGIYGFIAGLVNNVEDAQDLTQKTFLKAWEKLPDLHDPSKFKPWLYTIARNLVHDHRRLKKKIFWESWERISGLDFLVSEPSCEEEIAEAQFVRLVLVEVPVRYRSCLLLQVVGGFSQHEIAELLGISKASVSTYLSIARTRFRQAYRRLASEQGTAVKRR
jgi:RNA polymerase sigma-70 factor (ECF subfamily)